MRSSLLLEEIEGMLVSIFLGFLFDNPSKEKGGRGGWEIKEKSRNCPSVTNTAGSSPPADLGTRGGGKKKTVKNPHHRAG